MKKFLLLIKNKTGSFFSVCLIAPVWILIVLVMVAQIDNHNTLKKIIEVDQNVSRMVMTSETFSNVSEDISDYILQINNLNNFKKYQLDDTESYINLVKVIDGEDTYEGITAYREIESRPGMWKAGLIVTYSMTIYTKMHDTNIFTISFGNKSFSLTTEEYTIENTVILL